MNLDPTLSNLAINNNHNNINNNNSNNNNEGNNASTSASSSTQQFQSHNLNGFNLPGIVVPSSSSSTGFEIDELETSPKEVVNGNSNGIDKGKGREVDLDNNGFNNSRRIANEPLPTRTLDPELSFSTNPLPFVPKTATLPSTPKSSKNTTDQIKKHWTTQEDILLKTLVQEHGAKSWGKLAKLLGEGTQSSIRTAPSLTARWCRISTKLDQNVPVIDIVPTGDILNGIALNGIAVEGEGMNALINAVGNAEHDELAEVPVASTSDITTTDLPAKKVKGKYSKWRPAEDEELTKLVFEHGPKDWHFIASKLTVPRSADSTCGRWTNFLFKKQKKEGNNVEGLRVTHPSKSNNSSKNPRWSPEEDKQLADLKRAGPSSPWAQIGERMIPPRSAGSCRARYTQHVAKKEEQNSTSTSDLSQLDLPIASTSSLVIPDFQIPHLQIPINNDEHQSNLNSIAIDAQLLSSIFDQRSDDITLDHHHHHQHDQNQMIGSSNGGNKRVFEVEGEEELNLTEEIDRRFKSRRIDE